MIFSSERINSAIFFENVESPIFLAYFGSLNTLTVELE